jgi:hypothetical protein
MKEKEDGRRSFLKHLLTGTAVVAGVAGTKKKVQAKNGPSTQSDQSETLYKETDTFKQYYKSLRY